MDENNEQESSVPPAQNEPIGSVNEEDMKTPVESPTTAPVQQGNTIEDKTFFKTRMGHIMLAMFVLVMIAGTAATVYLTSRNTEESVATVGELNTAPLDIEEPEVEEAPMIDYTQLPLGDEKYVTDGPKKGFVFSCSAEYNGGGAFEQGPWINSNAGTWDLTQKISVDGDIGWPNALWSANIDNNTRVLTSNNLPVGHSTGVYPIASDDEAYNYDRNPNQISVQDLSLTLPLIPSEAETPECVGGEVGIATTGVLIFNAFDAGGRDAVATEVQDECQGHPQEGSFYHYHGYSSCFEDTSDEGEHSDLLGYAFDGFGIFGLKGEDGTELTSNDLDECHGHKHNVEWDGEEVSIYHYHFTQDFPYTVSCFKGTPLVKALSVGEGIGGMMGGQMTPQEGGGPGGPIDDLPAPPGQQQ